MTLCKRLSLFHSDFLSSRFRLPSQKNLAWFSSHTSYSLGFKSNYNSQQIDKILKIVNSRSEDDLSTFDISKQRIKKIEMRKSKQGLFNSIEEILELDGFGIKVLEKFCESILRTPSNDEKVGNPLNEEENLSNFKKKAQYVSPAILENVRKSISSCIAFHFDLNFIAWTKIFMNPANEHDADRPLYVEDWNIHEIDNTDKKLSLSELMVILLHLSKKIPQADAYVIEAMQTPQGSQQPGSTVQLSFNVQRAQIFSMMSILMASRTTPQVIVPTSLEKDWPEAKKKAREQHCVYFLRNYLSSRLFKTYVGAERVSSETVIENILRYNYSDDQPVCHSFDGIDVPDHLRHFYKDCDRLERDYIGQSFLNGLTFMKLCVLKCPKTAAMLTQRGNK